MKWVGQVFAASLSACALLAAMGAPVAFATEPCSDQSDNWRNASYLTVRARVNTNSGSAVTAMADGDTKTLNKDYERIGGYQNAPGKNKDKEYTTDFNIDGVSGGITCTAKLKANSDGNVKYVSNNCTSTSGYTVTCERNYESTDLAFTVKYTVNKP